MLLKAQFHVFDLTLTRPVTLKFNFQVLIVSVSSRSFVCLLVRFAASIGS